MDEATRTENLARESAKWRTQYRAAQQEIETLKTRLAQLEAPSGSEPVPAGDDDEGAATAEASPQGGESVAAPESDDPEYLELLRVRDEAATTAALKRAGVLDVYIDDVRTLLAARNQLTVDAAGRVTATIDGQAVQLDGKTIERMVKPVMLRAEGVAGSGSRAPRPIRGEGGYDHHRAMNDPKYFREHQAEARAAVFGEKK